MNYNSITPNLTILFINFLFQLKGNFTAEEDFLEKVGIIHRRYGTKKPMHFACVIIESKCQRWNSPKVFSLCNRTFEMSEAIAFFCNLKKWKEELCDNFTFWKFALKQIINSYFRIKFNIFNLFLIFIFAISIEFKKMIKVKQKIIIIYILHMKLFRIQKLYKSSSSQ